MKATKRKATKRKATKANRKKPFDLEIQKEISERICEGLSGRPLHEHAHFVCVQAALLIHRATFSGMKRENAIANLIYDIEATLTKAPNPYDRLKDEAAIA